MALRSGKFWLGVSRDVLARVFSVQGCVLVMLLSLSIGLPLGSRPLYEVSISPEPPLRFCTEQPVQMCTVTYRLLVGNTGREKIDWVKIKVRKDALKGVLIPLQARSFDKVPYPVAYEESDTTQVKLTGLKPGKRIDLTWTLQRKPSEPDITWEQILEDVRVSRGEVVNSNPEVLTFGRFLTWLVT